MRVFGDVYAVDGFPALYLDDVDVLVIADLHLGYELISAEHGVFVPRVQFKKSVAMVKRILEKKSASRLLILGDVKHEFSETGYHEYKEVSDFFEEMLRFFKEVVVVRGNHDTFITRITRKYGIKVYDEFVERDYFFTHGHKSEDLNDVKKGSTVFLGHEHPSIALFTDVGVKEKMKCFLYGTFRGKRVVVLPAFSYFAEGSDVNLVPREALLSPLLRDLDVDGMKVIGILENDRLLRFPSVGMLRRFYE